MFDKRDFKVGFIHEGFELNKPLNDKTRKLILKNFNQDWEPDEDGEWIYAIPLDKHYKAEESLRKLIEEALKPGGYALNGEAFAEDTDSERETRWHYIVKDNEIEFVSDIELEEREYLQKLETASPEETLSIVATLLKGLGYEKIAQALADKGSR